MNYWYIGVAVWVAAMAVAVLAVVFVGKGFGDTLKRQPHDPVRGRKDG